MGGPVSHVVSRGGRIRREKSRLEMRWDMKGKQSVFENYDRDERINDKGRQTITGRAPKNKRTYN